MTEAEGRGHRTDRVIQTARRRRRATSQLPTRLPARPPACWSEHPPARLPTHPQSPPGSARTPGGAGGRARRGAGARACHAAPAGPGPRARAEWAAGGASWAVAALALLAVAWTCHQQSACPPDTHLPAGPQPRPPAQPPPASTHRPAARPPPGHTCCVAERSASAGSSRNKSRSSCSVQQAWQAGGPGVSMWQPAGSKHAGRPCGAPAAVAPAAPGRQICAHAPPSLHPAPAG